jgi:hypothetical protein
MKKEPQNKDFRIGNYVLNENNEIVQLCEGRFILLLKEKVSYNRIRLTEELCDRFGCYYGFGGEPRFELNDSISMSVLFINGNILCLIGDDLQVQIDFVHELQNLFFALTGEELELKKVTP